MPAPSMFLTTLYLNSSVATHWVQLAHSMPLSHPICSHRPKFMFVGLGSSAKQALFSCHLQHSSDIICHVRKFAYLSFLAVIAQHGLHTLVKKRYGSRP